ncbi:MAG: hypothetical protein ACO2PN_27695 [Pyrobaculum sp.]|jgi:hypothetical protein
MKVAMNATNWQFATQLRCGSAAVAACLALAKDCGLRRGRG